MTDKLRYCTIVPYRMGHLVRREIRVQIMNDSFTK